MNSVRISSLLLCFAILLSCNDSRWKVDESKSDYHIQAARLDKAVFEFGINPNPENYQRLKEDYGQFFSIYSNEIMQIGEAGNSMTTPLLARFAQDPTWQQMQAIVEKQYPNLDAESQQLEKAFRRYSLLLKESDLPKIVAYNSGFNVGIYPSNEWLGLGLEWYCGGDHAIIERLPPDMFPKYKRDKMAPEYLVVNALKGWLLVKYQNQINDESLLSRMVFSGKIHYMAKVLLTETDDQDLMNYSDAQLTWCEENAFDVWKYFLENDLIFSAEAMQVNKIMNDGPFTPGMPPESPGGIGNWIGYKIVTSFMGKNENVSLSEMMSMKNDREFLKHYKPGK